MSIAECNKRLKFIAEASSQTLEQTKLLKKHLLWRLNDKAFWTYALPKQN